MATYDDLYELSHDMTLLHRVTVAVAVAAEDIRVEDDTVANHGRRVLWAKRALANPDGMARQMMILVLAQNREFTVAQIQGSTDAALQNAVDGAIGLLL